MMYRVATKKSRYQLANPHQNTPLYERLKNNKSIDLRNNRYFVDHGNGYSDIKPIDSNKTFNNA